MVIDNMFSRMVDICCTKVSFGMIYHTKGTYMTEKIFTLKNYFWILSIFLAFIISIFLVMALSVAISSWTGIPVEITDGIIVILSFPLYILAIVKMWTIK